MEAVLGVLIVLAVLLLPLMAASLRIIQEYERGVVFRLGRLTGARGPGWTLIIPLVERMQKVDMRVVTMDVPAQEVITRDNVTVKVNAVLYFKVTDPEASVVQVFNFVRATEQIAQTTMRNVVGQSELDEMLAERERINQRLAEIIDEATEPWGVKVTIVEIKDIELPQGMQRAMARQAEAERERRAKIINADGEFQAAERLADAGRVMGEVPTTMQLRFLQTLTEISSEKNSTIVMPVPVDLLSAFIPERGERAEKPATPAPRRVQVTGDNVVPSLNGLPERGHVTDAGGEQPRLPANDAPARRTPVPAPGTATGEDGHARE